MKWLRLAAMAWGLCAAVAVGAAGKDTGAAAADAAALAVTDSRGVQVRLAQPPLRIVSLLPSLTETVCALGACERLVGVDRYSNWPASVRSLPVVGGGIDPDVEAIVALRPDLVLASTASRAVARLQALGLKVLALETRTQADARAVLDKTGRLLGLAPAQGAERVWAGIQEQMAQAAHSVPESVRGRKVYFEASRGPYAAGESSFIGETLTRLGMVNIVGAAMGPFPRINPEFVVRADPDFILGGQISLGTSGEPYPGWGRLRAMREGHVCRFAAEELDVLVRAGPRMAEAAWIMARCLKGTGQGSGQGTGQGTGQGAVPGGAR
jgi:iron complex transport system substrate-binding protein